MRQYLVSGFYTYGSGQTYPMAATATLEDHEVMDPPTLRTIELILLEENNHAGSIAQELRITSFQPFEVAATPAAQPVPDLNLPDTLPPVRCPILIQLKPGAELIAVERTGHVQSRQDDLEYRSHDGGLFYGRFPWTYP